MPRDEELEWLEFTDFSPGIHSNNMLAGGVEVTSTNPALAQDSGTFRCIALPTGGLGPLPRLQASHGLTTIPSAGNDYDYKVAGFSTWGRILNSPVDETSDIQTEFHIMAYWDFPAGSDHTTNWRWLRERGFDDNGGTETIRSVTDTDALNNGPRYSHFLKTRMNPSTPDEAGTPVMVGIGGTSLNNTIIVSRAWPDPANPDTNDTIIVGEASENDMYVVATAHQNRIVMAAWGQYDHGVDAALVTNENMYWTETNDNTLVSTDAAWFVPELDQSITDLCPMSANALLVIKYYGGGYVLQGDLSDVTVVQLPNLPCPDGSDWVRGVNTSRGYVYSAGPAGMYLWNGGDGAELISKQLSGNFAVGDNILTGANGQCDRWMDRVLVPQNWLWDTISESWWRLEDPDTANIRFWSTSARSSYAFGSEATFTDDDPDFIHQFKYDDLAYTWTWLSHPLWVSQARRMETRQGIAAIQGYGTITITLQDEDNPENTSAQTLVTASDKIRNHRWNISLDAENITVKIESSGDNGDGEGTYEAPLLHRMFLGYKQAQHLGLTN